MSVDTTPVTTPEAQRQAAYDSMLRIFSSSARYKPGYFSRQEDFSGQHDQRRITLADQTQVDMTLEKDPKGTIAQKPDRLCVVVSSAGHADQTAFTMTSGGLLVLNVPSLPREMVAGEVVMPLQGESFKYDRGSSRFSPEVRKGMDNLTPPLAGWVNGMVEEKRYLPRPFQLRSK